MQTHLKVMKSESSKGKSSEKVLHASDELQFKYHTVYGQDT